MSKRSDKEVSASRRGFFRQLLVSGIEAAENVGKAMAERAGIQPEPAPYTPPSYTSNPYWNTWDTYGSTYGPPWPPRFGPPIPPSVRAALKAQAHATPPGSVSAHDEFDTGD